MGISSGIFVTICDDLNKILNAIAHPYKCQEYQFLIDLIYKRIEELQNNRNHAKFLLVPSHFEILRNGKAHVAVKNRVEKDGKLIEQKSSVSIY